MKKLSIFILIFTFCLIGSYAQETINVWSAGNPPTSYNVSDEAQLTIYLPKVKNDSIKSSCVLIFPGGGYAGVSMTNEGHAFAKWLQAEGFAAIILKYRLPQEHKEVPFDDAVESIKIIKDNAQRWKINIDKFGIAGFSAGGHLATVFTNKLVNETESFHPSFNILFYPVISFDQVTKGGTRDNLLGKKPSAEDIRNYSSQFLVSQRTPPTILLLSDDDNSVPSTHSTIYYNALKNNKIPASLYIFPTGGHGWGMLDGFEYNQSALSLLSKWLNEYK